jgi:hypothetical protein
MTLLINLFFCWIGSLLGATQVSTVSYKSDKIVYQTNRSPFSKEKAFFFHEIIADSSEDDEKLVNAHLDILFAPKTYLKHISNIKQYNLLKLYHKIVTLSYIRCIFHCIWRI